MNIIGIIAEYNPFHNGHAYQIQKLKKNYQADYVIIAMSGNYVQRGIPAFTDKYTRAHMALSCGADLVLELPSIWSTASAEYFAAGGVNLLNNTKVVTHLCFGAETNDLAPLQEIADFLTDKKDILDSQLPPFLEKGHSFPTARTMALQLLLPDIDCSSLISSSNNILAIEYLKALKGSEMKPILIQRQGDGYHQTTITSPFASATALRQSIYMDNAEYCGFIPEETQTLLSDIVDRKMYLDENSISEALYYALWNSSKEDLLSIFDCSRELADKIRKNLPDYKNFSSFCELLKSKEVTYSRISRTLLHCLLSITKEEVSAYTQSGFCPYLRVLGFRKDHSKLLSKIKENSSVPIITKMADAGNILSGTSLSLLERECHRTDLYNHLLYAKSGHTIANEYSHPIIIL